jgi:hypothetical protein
MPLHLSGYTVPRKEVTFYEHKQENNMLWSRGILTFLRQLRSKILHNVLEQTDYQGTTKNYE